MSLTVTTISQVTTVESVTPWPGQTVSQTTGLKALGLDWKDEQRDHNRRVEEMLKGIRDGAGR